MKSAISASLLLLAALPGLVSAQDAGSVDQMATPMSTTYYVIVTLLIVGVLAGFCWYYMRWDEEEKNSDR